MSNIPDTTNGAAPMQAAYKTFHSHGFLRVSRWDAGRGEYVQIGSFAGEDAPARAEARIAEDKAAAVARDCGHDVIPGAVAARIVSDIRAILYRDPEGSPEEGLDKFDPDKERDLETLDAIAGVLEDAGLAPKGVEDYREVRVGAAAEAPVASPLETAREACRVAELSLRAALAAMGAPEHRLAWLHLYDLIAPAAKIADRLQTLVDYAS